MNLQTIVFFSLLSITTQAATQGQYYMFSLSDEYCGVIPFAVKDGTSYILMGKEIEGSLYYPCFFNPIFNFRTIQKSFCHAFTTATNSTFEAEIFQQNDLAYCGKLADKSPVDKTSTCFYHILFLKVPYKEPSTFVYYYNNNAEIAIASHYTWIKASSLLEMIDLAAIPNSLINKIPIPPFVDKFSYVRKLAKSTLNFLSNNKLYEQLSSIAKNNCIDKSIAQEMPQGKKSYPIELREIMIPKKFDDFKKLILQLKTYSNQLTCAFFFLWKTSFTKDQYMLTIPANNKKTVPCVSYTHVLASPATQGLFKEDSDNNLSNIFFFKDHCVVLFVFKYNDGTAAKNFVQSLFNISFWEKAISLFSFNSTNQEVTFCNDLYPDLADLLQPDTLTAIEKNSDFQISPPTPSSNNFLNNIYPGLIRPTPLYPYQQSWSNFYN